MDLGLQGRVAFVAGASAGLGYAAAEALAREGCHVAICSRDATRIQDAASRLQATAQANGARVYPVVCDVTDEAQIIAALADVTAHLGGVNILVTNAGGPPAGYIGDFDADEWRAALDLNLMSTINLCRHALPALKEAAQDGLARILMITSLSAKEPIPNLYLSNVARAGVQGFAKSLAQEVGPLGITVNTIMPGYTRTERLSHLSEAIHARTGTPIPEVEAGWAANTMVKRLGTPDEFGAAVAFMASAHTGFITGIGLLIDGGHVKHLL